MEFNKYQSLLDESKLDKEVYNEVVEFISTVKFLQNLTNPNRKRACECERDEFGRIKVDLINPHVLEDMDYFRPSALHYEKFKKYTNLYPNSAPNSEYRRFWREEARRCREGYVRELDGEWISGPYYFYLNYSIILKNKIVEGRKKADRYRGFPDIYDGDYIFFHYLQQCRDNGKHCGLLKRRGSGFSYKFGSGLARVLILGDTSFNTGNVTAFAIASEKEYLIKDGILNKFDSNVNWCAESTPWPRLKSKNSLNNMVWEMGYTNLEGLTQGTRNSVIGVTTQGDPDKAHPYSERIVTPYGVRNWGDIQFGDIIFGSDGREIKVTQIHELGEQDIYTITFNDGRIVNASGGHKWKVVRKSSWQRSLVDKIYTTSEIADKFKEYSVSHHYNNIRVRLNGLVEFSKKDVPIDSYTLGLILGDGTFSKCNNSNTRLTMDQEDLNYLIPYIPYKVIYESYSKIRNKILIPNGRDIYKQLNLYDTRSGTKFIPDIYKFNSKEVRFGIINGLLDSDGYVGKDYGTIQFCSKSKQLAEDFIWILRSLGIGGKITTKIVKGNMYYNCFVYCSSSEERLFNLPRKKNRIYSKKNNAYARDKREFITINSVTYSRREMAKCITVSANDSMYLIGDFVPTLNSRGKRGPYIYWDEWGKHPNLLKSWEVAKQSVEEGDFAFGTMIGAGTGGAEQADFKGAEKMFYEPEVYNILSLPNVFDKNTNGNTKCAFFFGSYLNRLGKYDKDGNSDVIGALIEILGKRVNIKYNSSEPNTLVQHKAEMPITPQEAVLRREGSIFPVMDLKDHLGDIMPNLTIFTGAHYIGHLKLNTSGDVVWSKDELHKVLRDYPLRDEPDRTGCVEIFEMPQRLPNSSVPHLRYIAGIDPIDSDEGTYTNSLGSIFIFDTWTDRIVAEYSGRPQLASEFYDVCARLLKFYNAVANYENNIKGLFSYFDTNRLLHLLCDTPQILRDMDYVKGVSFGNRSKGFTASKAINAWGRKLQKDWMISHAYVPVEDEFDKDGNKIEKPILLNLHKIRSIGYIKELISWNPDDNFDRISAMGATMILRADREKYEQYKYQEKIKSVLDDPWFKKFGYPKVKIINPAKSINSIR